MGNKPNSLLAKHIKNRPGKNFILAVRDIEGRRCIDNKEMNNIFRQFYLTLYSSEDNLHSSKYNRFFENVTIPSITIRQHDLLEAPLSLLEVKSAISSLQPGKSPGPDGYPVEFFQILQDMLSGYILKALTKAFEESSVSDVMNTALISLILKKGKDPEQCGSYRPISLLNVDIKILAEILAKRLEPVIPSVII